MDATTGLSPEVRCGLPLLSKLIALFGLESPEVSDVEELFVGSTSLAPNKLALSVCFAIVPGADPAELEPRLKRHISNHLYEYAGFRFDAFHIELVQSAWPSNSSQVSAQLPSPNSSHAKASGWDHLSDGARSRPSNRILNTAARLSEDERNSLRDAVWESLYQSSRDIQPNGSLYHDPILKLIMTGYALKIDLSLEVCYGHNLPFIARHVRDRMQEVLCRRFGIETLDLRIYFRDLFFEPALH